MLLATKGFTLNKLANRKAFRLIAIALMMALPAAFFSGCATGQVVVPFAPKEVKPEPYNPSAVWSAATDPYLIAVQSLKRKYGQAFAPGAVGSSTTGAGTTTPGAAVPITPTPPPPTPIPTGRIPSISDAVFGIVRDRVEGGVIPGAIVTLTERRGNQVGTFTTNANGEYSFVSLNVGAYTVSVQAEGYSPAPTSTRDFFYLGSPIEMDMELVYGDPLQTIEGLNFTARGTVFQTTPGIPDWNPLAIIPGSTFTSIYPKPNFFVTTTDCDVMPAPFWSAGPEQTFNAAIFDEGFDPFNPLNLWPSYQRRPGWVQYDFTVPSPLANVYSYDGFWVRTLNSWHVVNGVWGAGGNTTVFFYDWVLGTWVYNGNTAASGFTQPDFSAVNPTTGQVSLRMLAADSNPYVITQASLEYDYRKDRDIPTLSGSYVDQYLDSAVYPGMRAALVTAQVQENAVVYITVSGPGTPIGPVPTPVETHHGIYYFLIDNMQAGQPYTYSINLVDQAGHPSAQTYGPYPLAP